MHWRTGSPRVRASFAIAAVCLPLAACLVLFPVEAFGRVGGGQSYGGGSRGGGGGGGGDGDGGAIIDSSGYCFG